MSVYRIVLFEQAGAGGNTRATATEVREQIVRKSIQDAQHAAQEARAAAQAQGGATRIVLPPSVPMTPVPPGVPGYAVRDSWEPNHMIPPEMVDIAMGFFVMSAVMVIGWPIARAFGRRLERRGPTAIDTGLGDQLQRIERAVEAMSIEVERISESQRFMARLQHDTADRGALPSMERR